MRTIAQLEPSALERLGADEATLERSLALAREEAARCVAAARAEAERIMAAARGEVDAELARRSAAAERALAEALAEDRQETERLLAGLDASASRHRERALQLLLDAVLWRTP